MKPEIIVKGRIDRTDVVAFVHLPGAAVPIRVRHNNIGKGIAWKCDACGRAQAPNCPHAVALAAHIDQENQR